MMRCRSSGVRSFLGGTEEGAVDQGATGEPEVARARQFFAVRGDGLVHRGKEGPTRASFGGHLCVAVELGHRGGDLGDPRIEQARVHDLVEEPGRHRPWRVERLSEQRRALEGGGREPLAQELGGGSGHREADRDLVRRQPGGARRRDPVVAAEDQERSHRDRVTGARHQHGSRVCEHPARELESAEDHVGSFLLAGTKDGQVEAGGEHAGPASKHDDGVVRLRTVEGLGDAALHFERHRVDLPVVETDARDTVRQLVVDSQVHRTSPCQLTSKPYQ